MRKYTQYILAALVAIMFVSINHLSIQTPTSEVQQNDCILRYMQEHRGEGSDSELIAAGRFSEECSGRDGAFNALQIQLKGFDDVKRIIGDFLAIAVIILITQTTIRNTKKQS